MGFLYFLFFLVVGIWLFGLVFRATVNRWLRKRTEEYNRAANEARQEAKRRSRGKREGEVTIEAGEAAMRKKVSRSVGDYVEFEEVDEKYEEKKK